MKRKELYDKILVFPNAIFDSAIIRDLCQEIEQGANNGLIYPKWNDWYSFGRGNEMNHELLVSPGRLAEEYDKLNETQQAHVLKELYVFHATQNASEKCINEYLRHYSITPPESSFFTVPNISYYKSGVNTTGDGMVMNFHTDFTLGTWWHPGEKFFLTCTAYLNDDYDGGEIVFYVDETFITYKPQAGDVLVFPSGDPKYPGKSPYFHGVNMVENGTKYLVRTYLKYSSQGNVDLWQKNLEEFGEETWLEMAKEASRMNNHLYSRITESGKREIDPLSDFMKEAYGI